MARMADEAAGVLQNSERQLCAHMNALAVLTLEPAPAAGRGGHSLSQGNAASSDSPVPPLPMKKARTPRPPHRAHADAGKSAQGPGGQEHEPQWTAQALEVAEGWLQQSRTVGEHGIAELEGKGQGFGSMTLTAASHRAWRLIQVPPLP